jgi:hypothetical protein
MFPYYRSVRELIRSWFKPRKVRTIRKPRGPRLRLEELESRLAPATYAVDPQLHVSWLDNRGDTPAGAHAVVFFESSVRDVQVLRQGLGAGTDAVFLDSAGDGVRQMAAFLAGRHDLASIGIVAHGAPGAVALGTETLDQRSLAADKVELAVIGSALAPGGELDLWSCDVAAGDVSASFVSGLAAATRAGVAASDHPIGSAALGGDWQLNVRTQPARAALPFTAGALGAFQGLLGNWSAAASMATARVFSTGTLLGNGKILVTGGGNNNPALSSAELYDPISNSWSSAGSMATAREQHTATLLGNGKVLVTGGANTSILSSAELYDPVSNSWSSAGNMTMARNGHTATLLGNGKVLVTGGSAASCMWPVRNSMIR